MLYCHFDMCAQDWVFMNSVKGPWLVFMLLCKSLIQVRAKGLTGAPFPYIMVSSDVFFLGLGFASLSLIVDLK